MSINRLKTKILLLLLAIAVSLGAMSCSDGKSYAELLTEESHIVNLYLVDQRVSLEIPKDSTFQFEIGKNAPYYPLDEDGNVYMKVLKYGTEGNYADNDEVIYFRYTRYNLNLYKDGQLSSGDGNETDMGNYNAWFRFNNFQLKSSYQWGAGLQMPLKYLPIDSEVSLIIKSQYGLYDETTYVIPFLYNVRYYRQRT